MKEIVAGYDITDYATDPNHLSKIQRIYASIQQHGGVRPYIQFVHEMDPVPVTADMVASAALRYNVDGILLTALAMNDSRLGSRGLGRKTHNPGNVGNDDDGHVKDWGTWQAGVDAIARWLAKHRDKNAPS